MRTGACYANQIMTHTNSRIPAQLSIAFLLGLLLATSASGQEAELTSVELNTQLNSKAPESFETPVIQTELAAPDCDSDVGCCSAEQMVITSQSHCRTLPVYVCPSDEVWLVSARRSHCAPSNLSLLKCSRLENGDWKFAQLDELVHSH